MFEKIEEVVRRAAVNSNQADLDFSVVFVEWSAFAFVRQRPNRHLGTRLYRRQVFSP